jgi:hypothetical protein
MQHYVFILDHGNHVYGDVIFNLFQLFSMLMPTGANDLLQSTIRIVRSMFLHNCSFVIFDFDEFHKNFFVSWCKVSESVFLFAIKKMIECML